MRSLAPTVVFATAILATNAHADEPAAVSVDASYRSHILIADATALALTLSGSRLTQVGIATAFFGGPTVHLAHGNVGRALASAALRTGLTFGLSALAGRNCDGGIECLGVWALGGAIGYGASVAIDTAILARQTRRIETPRWTPQVVVGPNNAQVGVSARF